MKSVPFEFNGVTYALSFTAEALFTVFERYGENYDVISSTHCGENTVEGWKAACWLGALLAAQGELQRRYMGEEAMPMLTAEQLRRTASPADMRDLRAAILQAVALGLRRENVPDEDQEVDTVLAERDAAQKKTRDLAASALTGLRQAVMRFISASGRSSS